eukprot:MONOS_14829.1-p1 / transcript=MONOS_14829.1 / gene=MONOS_14829 / organism=Monocercomonoides_exilis_PA203 / gene_product=unspecified product / transcript_product=unspecified product / location=Mono_scaffold01082:1679-2352(+) / protein_length=140 / sequence_SO=supercontig / SO=protein_coding / is_pseudo=false
MKLSSTNDFRKSGYSSPYSRSGSRNNQKGFGNYDKSSYRDIFDDPYGRTASSYSYQEGPSRNSYRSTSSRPSSSNSHPGIISTVSDKYKTNPNSAAYEGGGGGRRSHTSYNDYYTKGAGTGRRGDTSNEYRVGPPELYR